MWACLAAPSAPAHGFDIVDKVIIDGEDVILRLGADESPRQWASRYIGRQLRDGSSRDAWSANLAERLEILSLFVENRRRLVSTERAEIRRHIRKYAKEPVKISLVAPQWSTRQDTPQYRPSADVDDKRKRLVFGLSLMNAWRRSDWEYYFSDAPPQEIRLESDFAVMLAMSGKASHSTLALCTEFLSDGGTLVVGGAEDQSAEVQGLLRYLESTSGLSQISPGRFQKGNAAPGRVTVGPLKGLAGAYVINLERRPDRWEVFVDRARALFPHGSEGFIRITASDGALLDLSSEPLLRLFNLSVSHAPFRNPHQDHGYRRNVLGCALSHIRAWKAIASSPALGPNDAFLILEDDVVFDPGSVSQWADVLWPSLERDWTWDAVWLGGFDLRHDVYGDVPVHPGLRQFSGASRTRGAGAFAYVVRRRTAQALLAEAQAHGVQQAVDWFLFDLFDRLTCYYAEPPLVHSPSGLARDSDNAEEYPPARLYLKHKHTPAPPPSPVSLSLSIATPPNGSTIAHGSLLRVQLLLEASEAATVAAERYKDARVCVELRSGSQVDVPTCGSLTSDLRLHFKGGHGHGHYDQAEVELRAWLRGVEGEEVASTWSVLKVEVDAAVGGRDRSVACV